MKYTMVSLFWVVISIGQELNLATENQLAKLPLKCLQQEYPNKLNQVIINGSELQSPQQLHPAFYGCFDWHSSVHGHWSLVFLMDRFPNLEAKEEALKKLESNITPANISVEIAYFEKAHEKSFERTYGWTWLLKLQMALEQSKEKRLRALAPIVQPLSDLLVNRYLEFLPKLIYPLRIGTHNNTAFGLGFAYEYAQFKNHQELKNSIEKHAMQWFGSDANCPFIWEPSGTDFLSPCLEELALMGKILPKDFFLKFTKQFLPEILKSNFTWEVARVSDRTDGHLVHLDGLNFSKAWNMYFLAKQYPKEFGHLTKLADKHLQFSLPSITDGNYEGEHWLASFALHALERKQ